MLQQAWNSTNLQSFLLKCSSNLFSAYPSYQKFINSTFTLTAGVVISVVLLPGFFSEMRALVSL